MYPEVSAGPNEATRAIMGLIHSVHGTPQASLVTSILLGLIQSVGNEPLSP